MTPPAGAAADGHPAAGAPAAISRLFVYGSLKEGFPNFHVNRGRRVAGEFVTVQRLPMMLMNGQLPCLLLEPGQGHPVIGQLFEVGRAELQAMDELERVGQPGGYRREAIDVRPRHAPDAAPLRAWVYAQTRELLAGPGPHEGPLAEYTPEQAQRLRW